MKTKHQNLEFGHKLGEIQNKPEKSTLEFQRGEETQKGINFFSVNQVSSCLSFFLSASTAATYIFTAPTCTVTITTLDSSALNAEFKSIMSIEVEAKFCHWVLSNTKTEFEKFFTCRRRASNSSLPALEISIRPWRAIRDLFGGFS